MKKTLTIFMALFVILSCQKSEKMELTKSPVDSLITVWDQSWNSKDSVAVLNLFDDTSFLTDDNIIAANKEEINRLFVRTNIGVVNNIKEVKLHEWNTDKRAGFYGTWELDVIIQDSLVAQPKGAITLNWVKNDLGQWKISNAHIHSFKPQ